jgi:DNA-binding protein H-NS
MADEQNQSIIEWLEIHLDNLSADDRKRLILEIAQTLSGSHIREMRDALDKMQQTKFEDTKTRLLENIQAMVAEEGLSVEDLFPPVRGRRAGTPAKIKYRSPDGQHVWSGMGPVPKWLKQLEDEGHNREEHRVSEQE